MRIVGHRNSFYVDAHDHYRQSEVIRVIEAGSWREWRTMARAANVNPIVLSTVQRICQMRLEHPEAGRRYARWLRWCEKQRASAALEERFRLLALARGESLQPFNTSYKHPARPPR